MVWQRSILKLRVVVSATRIQGFRKCGEWGKCEQASRMKGRGLLIGFCRFSCQCGVGPASYREAEGVAQLHHGFVVTRLRVSLITTPYAADVENP